MSRSGSSRRSVNKGWLRSYTFPFCQDLFPPKVLFSLLSSLASQSLLLHLFSSRLARYPCCCSMPTIRIPPRRMTRKAAPPPIEITNYGVVCPGNSGSTLGSPPPRDDGSPEEQANRALSLEVARQGLRGRAPDRQPYMFVNPHNMCYRNSALATLLNIEPFVGWLRLHNEVSPAGRNGAPESIMSYLYKMAEAYWLSFNTSQSFLDVAIDEGILSAFWADMNVRWQWDKGNMQQDVSDFLAHLWSEARAEVNSGYVILPGVSE